MSPEEKERMLRMARDTGAGYALGKGVEAVATAVTGNSALGKAAGHITKEAYGSLPEEVKVGTAVGAGIGVSGVAHAVSVAGAGAAFAATAPLIVPLAVGGAVIGAFCWLLKG